MARFLAALGPTPDVSDSASVALSTTRPSSKRVTLLRSQRKHIALTGFSPLSGHPKNATKNARTCSNVVSVDPVRRHLRTVINSANAKKQSDGTH